MCPLNSLRPLLSVPLLAFIEFCFELVISVTAAAGSTQKSNFTGFIPVLGSMPTRDSMYEQVIEYMPLCSGTNRWASLPTSSSIHTPSLTDMPPSTMSRLAVAVLFFCEGRAWLSVFLLTSHSNDSGLGRNGCPSSVTSSTFKLTSKGSPHAAVLMACSCFKSMTPFPSTTVHISRDVNTLMAPSTSTPSTRLST